MRRRLLYQNQKKISPTSRTSAPTTTSTSHGPSRTKKASRSATTSATWSRLLGRCGCGRARSGDGRYRRLRHEVHELEVHHHRGVSRARADLDDPRVASRPFCKSRAHVGEQLVHDVLRAQEGERLAAGVEIAAPPQRDHLLGD